MSKKEAKDYIKKKTFNAVITDMGGCDMIVEPDVIRAEDAYKAVDMVVEPLKDLVGELNALLEMELLPDTLDVREHISNVEEEML